MRVLIATGGFKEGPAPDEVCALIERGVRQLGDTRILTERLPLADGGAGLTALLTQEAGREVLTCKVQSPLSERRIHARYGVLVDGTAVIESSAAAGLALVAPHERNPLLTTTSGVGEMVADAFDKGIRRFIVGCGDSATNDAGMGFAAALGVELLDRFGDPVPPLGRHLGDVVELRLSARAAQIVDAAEFEIAGNPNSVLCGPTGTSRAYGPQKGAGPEAVMLLEEGMDRFASLLERHGGKEVKFAPGAGGAGGLAAVIYAIFGGQLRYSFDIVRRYAHLDEKLKACDLVLTAEGLMDSGTLSGKLPANVALYAKRFNKPVAAIVGGLEDDLDLLYLSGFDAVEVVTPRPAPISEALASAEQWLPAAAARLMRKFRVGELLHADRRLPSQQTSR